MSLRMSQDAWRRPSVRNFGRTQCFEMRKSKRLITPEDQEIITTSAISTDGMAHSSTTARRKTDNGS